MYVYIGFLEIKIRVLWLVVVVFPTGICIHLIISQYLASILHHNDFLASYFSMVKPREPTPIE